MDTYNIIITKSEDNPSFAYERIRKIITDSDMEHSGLHYIQDFHADYSTEKDKTLVNMVYKTSTGNIRALQLRYSVGKTERLEFLTVTKFDMPSDPGYKRDLKSAYIRRNAYFLAWTTNKWQSYSDPYE